MAFAKISSELTVKSSIELDNLFVLEYMPFAPESYTKVYIYGKYLASSALNPDNTIERLSKLLALTEDEIVQAFSYWEDQGLVKISSDAPLEVEYCPVRYVKPAQKKFSKTKYSSFNATLAKMWPNRDLLPSEYNEYYSCMEDYHIDTDAMLAIISYCTRLKGKDVRWQYIVKVAQNMANEGIHTLEEAEGKINALSVLSTEIKELFKCLKITRKQDYYDVALFRKWTAEYGFNPGTIFAVAKNVYGEMKGLDTVLTRYYSNGMIQLGDIEAYVENKDKLLSFTKELLIKLDVRYVHLDYYADYYVKEWLKLGFSEASLLKIADYCFRKDRKSCEKMNSEILALKDEGIISDELISEKYESASKLDQQIRELFKAAKISDDVTGRDRDNYNIWFNIWKMPDELLFKAAEMSVGDAYPKAKMASIIKEWHDAGVTSVSDIKKEPKKTKGDERHIVREGDDMSETNKKLSQLNLEDL